MIAKTFYNFNKSVPEEVHVKINELIERINDFCDNPSVTLLYSTEDKQGELFLILEDIYLNLQRFDKNPPNLGMFYNDGFLHCPYCGSSELHQEGVVQIGKNEYNKFLCNSCSNTSRGVKVGNKENPSNNLLVPVKSN